jgi:hypothetical protein
VFCRERFEEIMVRYIVYCMMAPEFLRLPIEKRQGYVPHWSELARKHSLKMLFWGTTLGVKEHAVFVFESNGDSESFFNFQREWLGLGTELAGTLIEYTRTITVH